MAKDKTQAEYDADYQQWLEEDRERYNSLGDHLNEIGFDLGTELKPEPLNEDGSLEALSTAIIPSRIKNLRHAPTAENTFCPTGEGGGIDPSCSSSTGGLKASLEVYYTGLSDADLKSRISELSRDLQQEKFASGAGLRGQIAESNIRTITEELSIANKVHSKRERIAKKNAEKVYKKDADKEYKTLGAEGWFQKYGYYKEGNPKTGV